MEGVGAVPVRAPVGHGPRGLQRGGDAWNYFTHDQARSRAYRWGEDGIAGICDERQRLCLALALWNGARPDPQGADVRPHQRRGQPRRGRQGVLVLPRQHAHALLPEVPVQVPAARVPVRRPRRHERAAAASRTSSTSCSTPASSTTTATSTSSSSTPRPRPTTSLMLVTAHNRGPGGGDAAPAADAVVPQHVVVGRRRSSEPSLAADGGRRARRASRARRRGGCAPTRRRALLFCENETNNERLFGAPNARAVPEGRDQRLRRRRRRRRGQPGRHGHEVRRPPRARDPGRRQRDDPRAPDAPAPIGRAARRRLRPRAGRAPRRRPTRSTPRSSRRRSTPDRALVMRQALAGLLWSKQYYEYDVHRWLREHGVNPWDAERRARRAQRAVVPHGRRRRHLDAGQVGVPVVRRLGPGLPLRAAVARRRRLRQGAGRAAAAHALPCIPTGRSRPTSGTSATSTRRCTAWAALFVYEREAEIRGAGRPRVPRSACSSGC